MNTQVTTNGRITIPAELRRKYGIQAGTRIAVEVRGNSIVLTPITDEYLKKLQGSLKSKTGPAEPIRKRRKDKTR